MWLASSAQAICAGFTVLFKTLFNVCVRTSMKLRDVDGR
jgi:hypothetical protein